MSQELFLTRDGKCQVCGHLGYIWRLPCKHWACMGCTAKDLGGRVTECEWCEVKRGTELEKEEECL